MTGTRVRLRGLVKTAIELASARGDLSQRAAQLAIVTFQGNKKMKRDFELIRKLLFYFEDKPDPQSVKCPEIEGYDGLTIKYHLLLMAQAGLIDYEPELTKTGRIVRVIAFNLTWDGHEFLDAIRNDGTWNRIKTFIKEKGATLSFDVIKAVALHGVRTMIGN